MSITYVDSNVALQGFTGTNCQSKVSACDDRPCINGKCLDRDGGYFCQCPQGWSGRRCENIIDWCKESPCQHGICSQHGASYHCDCQTGWTGRVCDVKAVSCQVAAQERGVGLNQLCQNGGSCR